MTKIGNTRYYYYDWTPTETGTYVVECYVENYVAKDSFVLEVVEEGTIADVLEELRKHDRTMKAFKFI